MRIGIDISQIVYKGTGVSRFIEGLVSAICNYDRTNEWVFLFSSLRLSLEPQVEKMIKNRGWKLVKMKLPPRGLSALWNDLHVLNIETLLGELDWFISSDWTEPPAKCKKATVVHDLVYLRYPETVDQLILKTQRKRLEWVSKETDLVFADSQATKDDLLEFFKLDPGKIVVNYPGIETPAVKKKASPKKPFVLTVGKIEPRKNLGRLIEAFEKLNPKDIDLLIVGPEGWSENLKLQNNIRWLGFVADEELAAYYSSCLFFIYPSIWEGFGYPVLEAMAHGAPVATSDTSSLKEIGEEAALLFSPTDVGEIKSSLQKLIGDAKLRKELSQKGQRRAKDFTWKKYYELMIKSLW